MYWSLAYHVYVTFRPYVHVSFVLFSETDWFVQEISAIEESFVEGQLPLPLPQIHLWTVISILIHLALSGFEL